MFLMSINGLFSSTGSMNTPLTLDLECFIREWRFMELVSITPVVQPMLHVSLLIGCVQLWHSSLLDRNVQFMLQSGTDMYSSCYTLGQTCTVHATLWDRNVQFMLHSGTDMYSSCFTLEQTCIVHGSLWYRGVHFMQHLDTELYSSCFTLVWLGRHWFSRGDNFPCYPLVQSIIYLIYNIDSFLSL